MKLGTHHTKESNMKNRLSNLGQKRDAKVTTKLFEDGHYVIRLKQEHIEENTFNVVKIVKEVMG